MASLVFPLRKQRRKITEVHDLPDDVLKMIFSKCPPVSRGRARAVCQRWRGLLDTVDERGYKVFPNESNHARLMICDRRRAILEKITSPPCCSYAVAEMVAVRNAVYFQDTFAPSALTNHAFSFDFAYWTSRFDICEVWMTNFGSFLERDQTPHVNSPLFYTDPNRAKGVVHKPGSYGATPPIDATNSRYSRAAPAHRSEGSSASASVNTPNNNNPYSLLPSSQKTSMESLQGFAELTEEMCNELAVISAGRFERLADRIRSIQPLSIIFNDHSFYQKRPTLLLFWFLRMLPNVCKLTFDNIQGAQTVDLHKIISVKGLKELTVKQPPQKAALITNENLLMAFLDVKREDRCRFKVRLEGKGAITTEGLLRFIKKWQYKKDIVPFHSILIDALAVSPIDFVRAATEPEDYNNNQVLDKNQEAIYYKRQLSFQNRFSGYTVNYKYEDGYLMFYYYDPKKPPKLPAPVVNSKPKVVCFTSVSDKTTEELEQERRQQEKAELAARNAHSGLRRLLGSFGSFAAVRTTA